MLRNVECSNGKIEYNLTYKNVKNINLRIKADGTVSVSAPERISENEIDRYILSKSSYIKNSLKDFKKREEFSESPKAYVSGENFRILGSNLRLEVIESSEEKVYSDGRYIFLKVKDRNDFDKKDTLLSAWMKAESQKVFNEVVNEIYPKFKKYGVSLTQIKIRNMQTRWGSCQPKSGIITLNSRLIEAPRICIEYVVMHEFCHFIHQNHSKNFYLFLKTMMPDWEERKRLLEATVLFCKKMYE